LKLETVYGIRPVVEALRSRRRKVFEVIDAVGNEEVAKAAAACGLHVKRASRQRVEELAGGGVHQGIVARVEPYPYSGLEAILSTHEPLVLVLDGVTDPRNLGAVLRAADGAGADGVVIPKDRAVGVTPAALASPAAGGSPTARFCG